MRLSRDVLNSVTHLISFEKCETNELKEPLLGEESPKLRPLVLETENTENLASLYKYKLLGCALLLFYGIAVMVVQFL